LVAVIMRLFSSRPDHPLGDAKELRRVLVELPADNSFKAVDEVYGWFESLQSADDFRVDHFFDVVRQLDEAAQPYLRQLTRNYLQTLQLSKSEERRLWTLCYNYWGEVSCLYARCIDRARHNPKDGEALKSLLPLAATRLLAARSSQLKWVEYRYEPIGEDLWRGLGQPYLAAEAAGYANNPVQLYPSLSGLTCVTAQYLQALIFHSSSMDSLMPLEIELAERLVAHFHPDFVFSSVRLSDNAFWVDAASGLPPARMARRPDHSAPGLRYFSPGGAAGALNELISSVERGQIPVEINLGGQYRANVVLPVLRHLALYWAPDPPQREFPRHSVKTRIAVLQGFDDCFTVFAGNVARLGKERAAASWVVENVSLGGFGARVDDLGGGFGGDALKLGALLCIQPEGGENWLLGVLRRFNKDSAAQARVGIEALSKRAQSVELRPRTSGFSATGTFPGILLGEGHAPGEARIVLPSMSFNLRQNLELALEGRRYLLTPIELEEAGSHFEIGRYRETAAD
jgi:hypothetical protein